MKVVFYIDSLQSGGAAKVIVTIANELLRRGHFVFIATDTLHKSIVYEIDKNITILPIYSLNHFKRSKVYRLWDLLKLIRRSMKKIKPDIIIGVQSIMFLIAKLASIRLLIPVIASDHTSFDRKLPFYIQLIRFYFYKSADAVTILSQSDYDFLGKRLPKKVVMPNPLSYPIFQETSIRRKNILAVGRLNVWQIKGFDILIEVWSLIADKYPDWILEIAGTGNASSFDKLKGMTTRLGIENRVNFLGFHSEIDKIMQKSSIFVLSSRVEGFGLVLIEAMSQGCACISFNTGGRQKEIISSPQSGILIENQSKDDLKKALIRLIEEDQLRIAISEEGKKEACRFSKEIITDQWELLFNRIIANNK
jgi:glycosyltransferase involved in cell wall biosynthesis